MGSERKLDGFHRQSQPLQSGLSDSPVNAWHRLHGVYLAGSAHRRLPDMSAPNTMISSADLASLVEKQGAVVLDASWYLPADGRDPGAEFLAARIPGAQFFDIETISDADHECPHMLPSEALFTAVVRSLGIDGDTRVVVYDGKGLFSAARAWWMFRIFGHTTIQILEGGLPGWIAAGYPTETGNAVGLPAGQDFVATRQREWLADVEVVKAALLDDASMVLDARSATRFLGQEPEPRPGVRPGHIPGSQNLHYAQILTDDPTRLKSAPQLEALFDSVGAVEGKTVVTTCGSGISACLLALALHELGRSPVAVYDGSWAEWGSRAGCPVAGG